jgi:hypothetical protein
MPQPDALTGRTDSKALEAWMDVRAGIFHTEVETHERPDIALQRVMGSFDHGEALA